MGLEGKTKGSEVVLVLTLYRSMVAADFEVSALVDRMVEVKIKGKVRREEREEFSAPILVYLY